MNNQLSTNIADFNRHFSVELAASKEQIWRSYGLRYRVYCLEMQYESADRFPDQRESDEFDSRSIACLVTHRKSGITAGCARLVMASASPDTEDLPIERFCLGSLSLNTLEFLNSNRDSICEVSRLAIDSRFRRRSGRSHEQLLGLEDLECGEGEKKTFSHISLALFMAITAMSDLTEHRNMIAMMQPYLCRLLRHTNIFFKPAGDAMQYHGARAPYMVTAESILEHMRPELHDFYYDIYRNFDSALNGIREVG